MKSFNNGKVSVEIAPSPKQKDPQVTLKITAPLSDWKALVTDLGKGTQQDSKTSFAFFDTLDDAVKAAS